MNVCSRMIEKYVFSQWPLLIAHDDIKKEELDLFMKEFLTGRRLEKFTKNYDVQMWAEKYGVKEGDSENTVIYRTLCAYDFLYSQGYRCFEIAFLHFLMTGEKLTPKVLYPTVYESVTDLSVKRVAEICGGSESFRLYTKFPNNRAVPAEFFSMGFLNNELIFVNILREPDLPMSLDEYLLYVNKETIRVEIKES